MGRTDGQRRAGEGGGLRLVGGAGPRPPSAYVSRDADRLLHEALRERRHCHVLAPPQSGKTRLALATAARLREEGCQVATIDLAALGSRNVASDAGRWYYTFAWRVVRELRIRADFNGWWQDRANLTVRQRLRDFFLEVVLASTRQPIVIFVDHIEAVAGQRATWEVFDAIRGCADARASEPDYARLAFVLLGEPGTERLIGQRGVTPFAVSTPVALADFDFEQTGQLARALLPAAAAARVAGRVWHWSGGQPALAHRLLAQLAARPGEAAEADVDELAARAMRGRGGVREEPHLALLAERILAPDALRAARLTVCGKVAKGLRVPTDPLRFEQRDLLEWGVMVDEEGVLAFRNRLYAGAFNALWANRNLPLTVRGIAAVALVVIAVLAAPVLYTEYVPRPYVRTLTAADQDFGSAERAWRRLGLLPGFGAMADRLFADWLVEQSGRATRLAEVDRLGARLARLPDGVARAGSLRAAFWARRAQALALRGDRDGAALYALQAAAGGASSAVPDPGALLGEGFARLAGTLRPGAALVDLEADPATGLVTTLDVNHEIGVWRPGADGVQRLQRLRLAQPDGAPIEALLGPGGRSVLSWPVAPGGDGGIEVRDVARDELRARLPLPPGLRAARFVLGGNAILLVTGEALLLHDADGGRLLGRLPEVLWEPHGDALSDDGRFALVRGARGPRLVDLQRLAVVGDAPESFAAGPVAVDPLGHLLAGPGDGDDVVVHDVRRRQRVARCDLVSRPVALRFDPRGRWLVVQSAVGHLAVVDFAADCRWLLAREGIRRWQVAFSPDGDVMLAGNLSRGHELLALPSGASLGPVLQPGMAGAGAAPASRAARPRVIPDMGLVLTYDGRKAAKLWALGPTSPRVASDAAPADGPGDGVPVTRVATDRAGRRYARGALDGSLVVRPVAGGPPRRLAPATDGAVIAIEFLPGDRWLAAATTRSVRVLDTATGEVLATLPIAAEPPALAASPDGTTLYIGGDHEGVTRWDWRSGATASIVGPSWRVRTSALSRDGEWLATSGADRVVRLWPAAGGSPLRQAVTVPAMVQSLRFSPDGRQLDLLTGAWLVRLDRTAAGLSAARAEPLPERAAPPAPGAPPSAADAPGADAMARRLALAIAPSGQLRRLDP